MKNGKYFLAVCLMAAFMFSCQDRTISIGIVGDQFGAYNTEKSFKIMEKGVDQLNNMSPDIVLHVGDMLESKRDIESYEDYAKNYMRATDIMDRFQCPWLLAVGDHDVVPPGYEALSEDRSRETWFMNLISGSSLPIGEKPYYSYDFKGYHFIVLYSMENLHTDPRWGSIFLNKINQDQLEWLKEDLNKNSGRNGNVVLVHHPHWYVWQNWKPVHDLLKEYKTHAVIAGHYHYDQDEGEIDGIRYLVMGCTGGVIKDTDVNSGSQEIAMLKLSHNGIKDLKLYDIDKGEELEWTPRISMDRIQAISCMLDNLWKDEYLYSLNGELYSGSSQATSSKIDLESLVNPIDIPIKIHIEVPEDICSDPVWIIDNENISMDTITFKPAYRSGWANYSSVGNWTQPESVWKCAINKAELLEEGKIELKIHVSFSDTQNRYMEKTQSYYITRN